MESDEDLARRSCEDPRAFEELVGRHGHRVHSYLRRRAPGEADDLLAETWLAAFEARHTFDPVRGPFVGWIFGVARNVLLAWLRRSARPRGLPIVGDVTHDEWAAVDARLDAAQVRPALREALDELPAVEREILLMVAWEQLRPVEIAGALGIPAGTARSRLHRARSSLAARLNVPADALAGSPGAPNTPVEVHR